MGGAPRISIWDISFLVVEAAILPSNLCSPTHHPQHELTSQVVTEHWARHRTRCLTCWLLPCISSIVQTSWFLECCVLCSPMGFHGKRAHSAKLLPKETGRGSHTESGGRRKAIVDVGNVRNTKGIMENERVTKTRNSHLASWDLPGFWSSKA